MALSKLQLTLGGISIGVSCCLLTTRLGSMLGSLASNRAAERGLVSSTSDNERAGGVAVPPFQPTDDSKLGSLWAGVIEVMLAKDALGEDIFLVPADSRPQVESRSRSRSVAPLPAVLRESVVFAMTAFDPVDPKETRSLEDNAAANERLWQEIKQLSPRPTKVWPTWGYNFDEGSSSRCLCQQ
eukprot:COSAG02_NODE_2594_length_8461_cov_189.802320_6_plen_184_part_00